jgi:hypothetical protein
VGGKSEQRLDQVEHLNSDFRWRTTVCHDSIREKFHVIVLKRPMSEKLRGAPSIPFRFIETIDLTRPLRGTSRRIMFRGVVRCYSVPNEWPSQVGWAQ